MYFSDCSAGGSGWGCGSRGGNGVGNGGKVDLSKVNNHHAHKRLVDTHLDDDVNNDIAVSEIVYY